MRIPGHSWLKVVTMLMVLPLTTARGEAAPLRIDNTGEPETLDPQMATGMREFHIVRELYEPLISYDANGQLVPGLASHWDVSSDGMIWTFHLRPATWSDGQPITADDAVFAIQRALLPATHAPNAYLFYPILNAHEVNTGELLPQALGIKALDAQTLQIRLTAPLSYMTAIMADPAMAPLPRHAIGTLDNTQWTRHRPLVVSGAYRLDHWTPRVEVVLAKNPAYYAASAVAIDQVIFYPIEDATTALNRYRSGGLDITYSQIPSARYNWARETLPDAVKSYPVLVHYMYLPNLRHGQPLADHRIREAMNLAIQRKVITHDVIQSGQQPSYAALPTVVSGTHPAPHFAFEAWSAAQRLESAKALMQAAGYSPEHPLKLEMALNAVDDHRRIAIALAAMWKPIGVVPHFVINDSSAHYSRVHQAQFQLARYGFVGMMMTPAEELSMFVSNASNNYGGYHNPDYDRLVDAGIHARDDEQAQQAFAQAERILLEDMVMIPLFDQTQSLLVSAHVKGWQPNAVDVHPIRYMSLSSSG